MLNDTLWLAEHSVVWGKTIQASQAKLTPKEDLVFPVHINKPLTCTHMHILCTTFQPLPRPLPQVFHGMSKIIQQCWVHSGEARLTALRVKKNLANLMVSKSEKQSKEEQSWETENPPLPPPPPLITSLYPFLSFLHHNHLCVFVCPVYYSNVISKQFCIILVHVTGPYCGVQYGLYGIQFGLYGVQYCIIWCTIWFILWYPLPIRWSFVHTHYVIWCQCYFFVVIISPQTNQFNTINSTPFLHSLYLTNFNFNNYIFLRYQYNNILAENLHEWCTSALRKQYQVGSGSCKIKLSWSEMMYTDSTSCFVKFL